MAPPAVSGGEFKPRARVQNGLLELIVVTTYAGLMTYYPTIQQYLYNRTLDEKRGVVASFGQNRTSDSGHVCHNETGGEAEAAAEAETAEWLLYINLSSSLPGFFSTLVIGAITDTRGRKLGMIIPSVGTLIKVVLTMLVIKLNWPIFVLLISGFLDGCLGSFGTVFVADITEAGKPRTVRITILQALLGVCGLVVSVGTGYFIKAAGFFYPILTTSALLAVVIVLVIFCLPETIEPSDDPIFGINRLTATVKLFIKPREGSKRLQLILLLLVYLLLQMTLTSKGIIDILYQMGYPFCWLSVKLGICSALGTTVQVSSMLILLRPLTKCFHENVICMFGLLSTIGELLVTGLAINDIMLFLAPVVGFFCLMPAAMIKSMASILIGPEEQGALFAGISSLQLLCLSFGNSMFNSVYASTVSSFPGLVYLLMAGIILITLGLIGAVEVFRRKHTQIMGFEPIPNSDDRR